MADIENVIKTKVDEALAEGGYPDIMGSTYQDVPASFPWVFFEMEDSYEDAQKHNSSRTNNHEVIVFQADIYSSKKNGAKAECKKIEKLISAQMSILGFEKVTAQPLRPSADVYQARMFARYRAKVDENHYIYHT